MQDFKFGGSRYNTRSATGYDEGLRQYFLRIYSLMSGALVVTAVSAFAVLTIPALRGCPRSYYPGSNLCIIKLIIDIFTQASLLNVVRS